MRHTAGLVGVTLVVGIATGVIGTRALNAQQESVKATMLLRTDLAGLGEKEGQVFLWIPRSIIAGDRSHE